MVDHRLWWDYPMGNRKGVQTFAQWLVPQATVCLYRGKSCNKGRCGKDTSSLLTGRVIHQRGRWLDFHSLDAMFSERLFLGRVRNLEGRQVLLPKTDNERMQEVQYPVVTRELRIWRVRERLQGWFWFQVIFLGLKQEIKQIQTGKIETRDCELKSKKPWAQLINSIGTRRARLCRWVLNDEG